MKSFYLAAVLMAGMAGGQQDVTPLKDIPFSNCGGGGFPACEPPEPLDIPAIQVQATCAGVKANAHPCGPKHAWWTCADKSRILEHDENTPPKYWCRKVQP